MLKRVSLAAISQDERSAVCMRTDAFNSHYDARMRGNSRANRRMESHGAISRIYTHIHTYIVAHRLYRSQQHQSTPASPVIRKATSAVWTRSPIFPCSLAISFLLPFSPLSDYTARFITILYTRLLPLRKTLRLFGIKQKFLKFKKNLLQLSVIGFSFYLMKIGMVYRKKLQRSTNFNIRTFQD